MCILIDEIEYRCKELLNQKNYILRPKRITDVEIDGIIENIRLKIWDNTEDHSNGVNGDKMDTNVIEHQKRDQESKNTDSVKQRITNTQVLKESSTQVGIS